MYREPVAAKTSRTITFGKVTLALRASGSRLLPSGRWSGMITGAVVSCLVTAGIAWAIWPGQLPAPVPSRLASGTVQTGLLTPDQVSRVTGVPVIAGPQADQVPAEVAVTPLACAAAAGPSTQAVYGHSWTRFLSATYTDAGGSGGYTVNQVVGGFSSSNGASAAFGRLTGGLAQCSSSTTTGQAGRTTKWAYKTYPATPIAVAWTAAQADGGGWSCYHQAQLSGKALVQVAICEGGNGAPATSALVGALSRKVSG